MTAAVVLAVGERFGRLTVVERVASDRHGQSRWKCLCDCGNVSYPLASNLRSGGSQSCGCKKKESAGRTEDITGERFGRLTVVERVASDRHGQARWKCLCDCGNFSYPST